MTSSHYSIMTGDHRLTPTDYGSTAHGGRPHHSPFHTTIYILCDQQHTSAISFLHIHASCPFDTNVQMAWQHQ